MRNEPACAPAARVFVHAYGAVVARHYGKQYALCGLECVGGRAYLGGDEEGV
jgi:hypothetical protein